MGKHPLGKHPHHNIKLLKREIIEVFLISKSKVTDVTILGSSTLELIL